MVALEHVCIQAVIDTHGLCVRGNRGGRSGELEGRHKEDGGDTHQKRRNNGRGRGGRGGERLICSGL